MSNATTAAEFVRALAPALRQSASIARALEGRVRNRPKAGETTPVKAALTLADTACQETLLVPLLERFPDVRLEAEEDTPTAARFAKRSDHLVVVDPIDGTLRFYLEAMGPYAVMIGLAVRGVYQAALVALPREELYFDAVRGGPVHAARADEPPRAAGVDRSGDRVLVSHDLPEAALAELRRGGLRPEPAAGGAIAVAPLVPGVRAGLRLAAHTPGGVSIRGRIGALVAEEAGALVCDDAGEPFPRELDTHAQALLVAAHRGDVELLRKALAACRSD